jgi:X-X-X-Leu-X-X-Gly heptad repeat protein
MRKLFAATIAFGMAMSFTLFAALPASAQSALTPSRTIDRELVSISMNADGVVTRTSLVDSLTVFGNGAVSVTDRNEPKGLRNLAGFQAPTSAKGIDVRWDLNVVGSKDLLTVAPSIDRALPFSVTPRYLINGSPVKASKLVGYSGDVTIEYDLANLTGRAQSFDITTSKGTRAPSTLETFVPFVAQTSFELPSSIWTSIEAPGASIVTDDNNLNHVTFTSILAPLVGTPRQTISLTGHVRNLEMRETRIVFQPLLPGVAEATATATADGVNRLFAGVGQVDANLALLRDGTLELIAGLEQLYAGILDARAGLGDVGMSDTIIDGMQQVLAGLADLGDAKAGVPAIKAGVDDLVAGVKQILTGLGSTSSSGTVLGGLQAIDGGLGQLGAPAGLPAAKAGVDQVNAGLAQAKTGLAGITAAVGGSVAEIQGAMAGLGCPGSLNAACPLLESALNSSHGLITATQPGLAALSSGTDLAIGGLGQVSSGLGSAIGAIGQLDAGTSAVIAGVQAIKAGLKSGNASDPGILEGLQSVAGGLTQVVAGIGTVGAADTLTDGASRLLSGSQDLASGVDQIASGTNDAAAGAKQIGDGQGALRTEGTQVLQSGVGDNVQQASAALAVLGSMKQRAAAESSLYGPPAEGEGSTTYVAKVAAITSRNMATLIKFAVVVALLMALIGAGVTTTRRAGMTAAI